MQVEELHQQLYFEIDKLGSRKERALSDWDVDTLLNKSIFDYFEIFAHGRNPKGFNLGFEVTQQRIDMLHTLVRDYPEQPLMIPDNMGEGIYRISFDDTKDKYRSYISSQLRILDCTPKFRTVLEQHGDLSTIFNDYDRMPSKFWQRAVVTIRNNYLYIYTLDQFTVSSVELRYLKEPLQVSLGTYTRTPTADNPNPEIKPRSDTDLPDEYQEILINIAKQNYDRIYNKQSNFQSKTISVT